MILYFNRNGQLLENLEYGSVARVGTTEFQIFAYFEDYDDYSVYQTAMISFRKPDLSQTVYPDLFMTKKEDFVFNSSIQTSTHFVNGRTYRGFLFDFGTVRDGASPVPILDTPGTWEASIILENLEDDNVTGIVRFTVEEATSEYDDDEVAISLSELMSNIRNLLLNDYVPYTAAIKNINLADRELLFGNGENYIRGNNEELYVHGEEIYFDGDYLNFNVDNVEFHVNDGGITFYDNGGAVDFQVPVHFNGTIIYEGSEIASQQYVQEYTSNNYVPYTGADKDVNLGTHELGFTYNGQEARVFMGSNYNLYLVTSTGDIILNPDGIAYYNGNEIVDKGFLANNYVPYTGADKDVHLNTRTLYFEDNVGEVGINVNNGNMHIFTQIGNIYISPDSYAYYNGNEIVDKGFLANNYVPFSGSAHNLDLGNNHLIAKYIETKGGKIVISQTGGVNSDEPVICTPFNGADTYWLFTTNAPEELGQNIHFASKEWAQARLASSLTASLDSTNFQLTLALKNPNGSTLSTQVIDFPLEELVVSGEYDEDAEEIILTLKDGNMIAIPLTDLVSGLATKEEVEAVAPTFEEEENSQAAISIEFENNTDKSVANSVTTTSTTLVIPSGIELGFQAGATMLIGSTVPTFSLTNNSGYSVYCLLNSRQVPISQWHDSLEINSTLELMCECNGFNVRIYGKSTGN